MKPRLYRGRLFVAVIVSIAGLARSAEFNSQDVGSPPVAGHTVLRADGALVISGCGAGLGVVNEQFHFAWLPRTGDFDVQVRVESVAGQDLFALAALTARATLEPGNPFAAVVATPSVAGLSFLVRPGQGTSLVRPTGSMPANYPWTWLRLRRIGDEFTGATSYDGRTWAQLGTAVVPMTNSVYLGFAVSGLQTNQNAVASFRDFTDATGVVVAGLTPPIELPGPTSRRTGLAISEIMYHPPVRADGRDLEFVELFNSRSIFEDLSGYRLSGALDYTFPEGTVLPAGGFLVVARVPEDVRAVYGLTNVVGGFTNRLDNGDGTVRLRNRIDAILQEVHYSDQPPWPMAADGTGHSLALLRPSYGEANPKAWSASAVKGGSPGRWDGTVPDRFQPVVLNELLTHTDPPDVDYVELYNHSNEPVDLSGAWLSDDPATNKFRIPDGTTIPARGHRVFTETELGFALSAAGEDVLFSSPDQSRVIDAVRLGPQANGMTYGRCPDGAGTFRALAGTTPGGSNSGPWLGDVVINEILYNPVSGDDEEEFVELHNRGVQAVEVGGWQLTSGIRYTFTQPTPIPAGGYLVVAKNAARLRTNHLNLNAQNCVGDYQGSLANGGEAVTLSRPEDLVETNDLGVVATNRVYVPMAEVAYGDGGRWGQWTDGGGSSLELIDPNADPTQPSSWADSDETAKGDWTTIEHTGVLDLGINNPSYGPTQLQLFLEGVGECLVDDVEVIGPSGTNKVVNGNFENGLIGWTPQGSHRYSTLETNAGVGGSQCLYVRAESRGDPGANRIRVNVAGGLQEGQTATLRAKVRWLRGFPEFLMRLRGNYLEAYGRLDTSSHPGTPGAPNSRRVPNAPPALSAIVHSPILPAGDQPVVVTARAFDPDGLATFQLRYRVDPGTNIVDVPMVDDGTGGDAIAGDGTYSAVIPGQPANTGIAFHIRATDASTAPAVSTFPPAAPAKECVVRFGELQPGGSFGTYRIWMTDAVRRLWTTREKLNNAPLDVTFVYGNSRVIYNAGSLYIGSPFVSSGFTGPTGVLCGYAVRFPEDDLFLGVADMKLDWPVRDGALQMEQAAFWIAEQLRIPSSHRRFINLFVNGVRRGTLYEDAQQPNSDLVDQLFPDDADGDLYKIDDWFEFDAAASGFANVDATLDDFTTTDDEKKVARYRWNWRKRAVQDSANRYDTLFSLVDAVTAWNSPSFVEGIQAQMDVEEWMRVIAVEHLVGNWDSFGYFRGKNMFAYRPQHGRWNLLMWDIDFVLSASGYPADQDLYSTIDPAISTMFFYPAFRRVYLRALSDAVNGPLQTANFGPFLAANYRAFQANAVTAGLPSAGSNYLTARLRSVQRELTNYLADFTVEGADSTVTVGANPTELRGTAPVQVETLLVNGVAWPITWISETQWLVRLPLDSAANTLRITGLDSSGQAIAGFSRTLEVRYTGAFESPVGHLVFNEIMHHPAQPGAEFVELLNVATNTAFDLSGWRISGLDYIFPAGSSLGPGGFLVVTPSRVAFSQVHGPEVVPFDEFAGNLNPAGETLRLIQPGATPVQDRVVAEVTYGTQPPWPTPANAGGISLQLKDPTHDTGRIGNWDIYAEPTVSEWTLLSVTGPVPQATNAVLLYLSGLPPIRDLGTIAGRWDGFINFGSPPFPCSVVLRQSTGDDWGGDFLFDQSGVEERIPLAFVGITNNTVAFGFLPDWPDFVFTLSADRWTMSGRYQPQGQPSYPASLTRSNPGGDVFVDDVTLVQGSEPEVGPNSLQNGGFEAPLEGSWTLGPNLTNSIRTADLSHGGAASLHLAASTGGYSPDTALLQTIDTLEPGATYTLSARVRRGTNATALVLRLADWSLNTNLDLTPLEVRPLTSTPGASNAVCEALPVFPPVWINELQPVNVTGPADRFGEREPWVELFNAGTVAVDLQDWCLTDSYTNLARWRFPTNAAIQPGQFLLTWLDAEPGESDDTEWHANFRVPPASGTLAFSRLVNGEPRIIDYLTYLNVPYDHSIGWATDGVPDRRQVFLQPTPRVANVTIPTIDVVINEWMAANDWTLADPADGDYEDWFELYNRGASAVDLGGFLLSDSIATPDKFVIPAGTSIPAHGYLLIWADKETTQNRADRELHLDFKLDAEADVIVLSAPDGRRLDAISFVNAPTDVSEGRWPDGTPAPFQSLTRPTPRTANVWWPEVRVASAQWLSAGQLQLNWTSAPGLRYRLLYKNSLNDPAWSDVGQEFTATSTDMSLLLDAAPGVNSRFFRLVLVQP